MVAGCIRITDDFVAGVKREHAVATEHDGGASLGAAWAAGAQALSLTVKRTKKGARVEGPKQSADSVC